MTQALFQTDTNFAELNLPLNGRYRVIEVLSTRLWACTYRAQDLHRSNQVDCIIHHLKTIPAVPSYSTVVRELFFREAAILEQLGTHAQIPQLLASFEDDQGFYIVQEAIDGQPLSLELTDQQPWNPEQVLQLLQEVLSPLAWVHRHGSIHGNLKPDNLLRRYHDGRLVLIDLGTLGLLQHTVMAAHDLLVPPPIAAQQGYQPLEQLQGLPCAASDVFTLGMIAVQALTGLKPTEFRVNPETIEILWKEHLPASSSPLQQELVPILDKMVQWILPDRYANADQVLLALQDVIEVYAPSYAGVTIRAVLASPIALTASIPVESIADDDQAQGERDRLIEVESQPVTPDLEVVNQSSRNQQHSKQHHLKSLSLKGSALRLGAGGIAVASTCAAVGWGFLNSEDWSTRTALWNQVTEATRANSGGKSHSARTVNQQWRQDWQRSIITYQQAEKAFNQGEWAAVRRLAIQMPDIPYWRDRGSALAQQATVQAEAEASQRLTSAFDYAYDRQFTNALKELKQIDPDTSVDAVVQAKTKEYREKENIKASFDLQQAYNRAIVQDFDAALQYLFQIPQGTDAYPIAQTKIAEYKAKKGVNQPVVGTTTDHKPQQLLASISSLETVSSTNPEAAVQVEAYLQELNRQAELWLQTAERQAKVGQLEAAIATLENVPLGTPAYAQARDRILELTALLHPSVKPEKIAALQVQPQGQSLDSGNPLQPSRSVIIGRATLQQVN